MKKYEFDENNSGGSWWLGKKEYDNLLANGWEYEASEYDLEHGYDKKGMFGDDEVPYGWRHSLTKSFNSMREAIEDWEKLTGQDFFDPGCACCGAPFSMSAKGEYESGGSVQKPRPW
jgi:hypothetical protein